MFVCLLILLLVFFIFNTLITHTKLPCYNFKHIPTICGLGADISYIYTFAAACPLLNSEQHISYMYTYFNFNFLNICTFGELEVIYSCVCFLQLLDQSQSDFFTFFRFLQAKRSLEFYFYQLYQ